MSLNQPGLAMASNSKPLVGFAVFSKLPPELRVKIIKMAMPGPRLVTPAIRGVKSHKRLLLPSLESRTPVPVVLQGQYAFVYNHLVLKTIIENNSQHDPVNRETRDEAEKIYKLSFKGMNSDDADDVNQRGSKIWFAWREDTLLVSAESFSQFEGPFLNLIESNDEFDNITRIVATLEVIGLANGRRHVLIEHMNLDKLVVVVRKDLAPEPSCHMTIAGAAVTLPVPLALLQAAIPPAVSLFSTAAMPPIIALPLTVALPPSALSPSAPTSAVAMPSVEDDHTIVQRRLTVIVQNLKQSLFPRVPRGYVQPSIEVKHEV